MFKRMGGLSKFPQQLSEMIGRESIWFENPEMVRGEVVVNELEMASINKKNIVIPDYVVMPDHVHIIVGL